MSTIDSNKKTCTLINVFTVEPEKHLELFELLKEATEKVMSKLPGYISANLHISDEKNYYKLCKVGIIGRLSEHTKK
ncbi:MAG: antibiotic biosynthesis monooxygenase [Ferruginibacter sp.]